MVCAMANIYGPNEDSDRRVFWDFLSSVHLMWDVPWCFGGDFNIVRYSHEKSREGGLLLH